MRILPRTLKHDGFDFRHITRAGRVAIYAQYREEFLIGYELIIIQAHKGYVWPDGRVMDAGESYPRSQQWGEKAWTYKSLGAAMAHMAVLVQQSATKQAMTVTP